LLSSLPQESDNRVRRSLPGCLDAPCLPQTFVIMHPSLRALIWFLPDSFQELIVLNALFRTWRNFLSFVFPVFSTQLSSICRIWRLLTPRPRLILPRRPFPVNPRKGNPRYRFSPLKIRTPWYGTALAKRPLAVPFGSRPRGCPNNVNRTAAFDLLIPRPCSLSHQMVHLHDDLIFPHSGRLVGSEFSPSLRSLTRRCWGGWGVVFWVFWGFGGGVVLLFP